MRTIRTLLPTVLPLSIAFALCTAPAPGRAQTLGPQNPGFEEGGTPAGWTAEIAPQGGTGSWSVDAAAGSGGRQSLHIAHLRPARFRMVSSPVRLEIGKLYRVSGMIKTVNAAADPLARYPTAVPAAFGMASFPFTNTTTPVGGTRGWTRSEAVFVATKAEDRVVLQFGVNGTATGDAWFDDVSVEPVTDVREYVPMETVRWYGPAYRYSDRGWTYVHIEGEPYERGYQYGYLLAKEISVFQEKLAVAANNDNPRLGWETMRTQTDALFLRRFDEEYLTEMRGIADGAAAGGAQVQGRAIDFLDVVTINSAVDLGQLGEALVNTAHPLSGRSFREDEEEARLQDRLHKCSSFLANGPASADGRVVFAQLFMWAGYTGVHWEVICDVVPAKGHRLVYETFPGGIHSGADWYINGSGIMIGETTTMQTPFEPSGEPQSSRIRKAAQYASSIDDAVRILTTKNNGLYTNDWLIADTKTDETAILLLGTRRWKLWRSSKKDFPGGTDGFYWSVNTAKDPDVRKEYVPDPSNAPFDVVYSPSNRDIAFTDYYRREKGKIDAVSAVNVVATSPINRPHACDGKVTTSAMAERLVFMAHYGKVTLREKVPERGSRRMPDLPNAVPHLTAGYAVFSPIEITEGLKALRSKEPPPAPPPPARTIDPDTVRWVSTADRKGLWINTVYPASDADNWFPSGTAAYWQMLNGLPSDPPAAAQSLRDQLGEIAQRLAYVAAREGTLAPAKATRRYDGYAHYQIPRIRGTVLLHQLRLRLGNDRFLAAMRRVHERYREKPMTTAQFTAAVRESSGDDVSALVAQWVERDDLPAIRSAVASRQAGDVWETTLEVTQEGRPMAFRTTVAVEAGKQTRLHLVEVRGARETFRFSSKEKPSGVVFNWGNDVPTAGTPPYTHASLFDDFKRTLVVYGTGRQVEAHHTIALRYRQAIADQFTEDMLPVLQDNSLSDSMLAAHDLLLVAVGTDNRLAQPAGEQLGFELGRNFFRWRGTTYGNPDDGLFVAGANPWNPSRAVYCFVANSPLQLWQMTKRYQALPAWGLFKGEQVVGRGFSADPAGASSPE